MACEHFEEGLRCRCGAVEGLLTPSLHERERYCRAAAPVGCPTYRARAARGARLSQAAYYALWTAPPTEPASLEEARRDVRRPDAGG